MFTKNITLKLGVFILLTTLFAQTAFAAFTDVSQDHENYQAINYLQAKGIIQGYDDGTFRPHQEVARAEAVKIIMAPLHETFEDVTENPFPDVTPDLWFAKFVKKAKDQGVVSGDGATGNFEGIRSVNLVEFLKILILAYNVDLTSYQNQTDALFNDVTDLSQWYIPYIYYASSTNIIHGDNQNNIYPGKSLTRAEVAEITYRLIVNMEGGETQLYLSMTEAEIINILQTLDNNISQAEESSARALEYANTALTLSPDTTLVQAAYKIAEAFDKLVKGYKSGINQNYPEVEAYSTEAWALADEAQNIDASVNTLAANVKDIAHAMADDARNASTPQ